MRAKMPLWHAHLHMTAHRPRRNRLSSPINGPSAHHASRRLRPRRTAAGGALHREPHRHAHEAAPRYTIVILAAGAVLPSALCAGVGL